MPSPQPRAIVELEAVRRLLDDGIVAVACGGGGIPVVERSGRLDGVDAVIDKDLTSALLATELGARRLVIVTDVPALLRGYGTPAEEEVRSLTPADAEAAPPGARRGLDAAQARGLPPLRPGDRRGGADHLRGGSLRRARGQIRYSYGRRMRDRRLLIGLGVIVALVALFLVFRPGDDDEEGTGTTTTAVTAPPTLEPTATETETATTAAPPEGTQLVVTIRGGEPVGRDRPRRRAQGRPGR